MTTHIDEDTLKQIVADQSKNDDEILQEILDQFQEFEEAHN